MIDMNMVVLATVKNENFVVSDMEIEKVGKTYTIDTLRELKKMYPTCEYIFYNRSRCNM